MKNALRIILLIGALAGFIVASAQDETAHLILINKDLPMLFTKLPNDKMIVSPNAMQFVVETGQTLEIDLKSTNNTDETYLRGEGVLSALQNVFFGIQAHHGQAIVYGFIDNAIAYSYIPNVIVFCSPKYYQNHDGCLN